MALLVPAAAAPLTADFDNGPGPLAITGPALMGYEDGRLYIHLNQPQGQTLDIRLADGGLMTSVLFTGSNVMLGPGTGDLVYLDGVLAGTFAIGGAWTGAVEFGSVVPFSVVTLKTQAPYATQGVTWREEHEWFDEIQAERWEPPVSPVPEPSNVGLLGLGLLGIWKMRRAQ